MKDAGTHIDTHEEYVPRLPRRKASETGRLGREIYKREISHKVEPDHIGKYVAIDVGSGCWALGDNTTEARERLAEQRPDAVDVLMEWIGYEAVGSIGVGAPRRTVWSKE